MKINENPFGNGNARTISGQVENSQSINDDDMEWPNTRKTMSVLHQIEKQLSR